MNNKDNPEVALSVSELVLIIKQQLENEFSELYLEGELSNLTQSSTGHWYFNISDQDATISCCLFRNQTLNAKEIHNVKDGEKIRIFGNISVYAKRTAIQVIVKKIIPINKDGDLKKKFELLKTKLSQEGLFDLSRKKKLPEYVTRIAVISAENAAALKDFITVMRRRCLEFSITISPAIVQGEKASESIIKALDKIRAVGGFELVVITRGGGSQEDLWCFNDEALIRRIAQCEIPVISAVGHEVDYTLCDFVADLRCETPTAAAEVISSKQLKIQDHYKSIKKQMHAFGLRKHQYVKYLIESLRPSYQMKFLQNILLKHRSNLQMFVPKISFIEKKHYQYQIAIEQVIERISSLLDRVAQEKSNALDKYSIQMSALDPYKVLGRGYAIIQSNMNELITTAKKLSSLKSGENLKVQFSDGLAELTKK